MLSATLLDMQVPKSSRSAEPSLLTVDSDIQAALLQDPITVNCMVPFWEQECTIAEAARELQQPINSVHYRVSRLVNAGLLAVTRTVPRAGRPIKHYRTVANRFLIPDQYRQTNESMRLLTTIEPTMAKLARGLDALDGETTGRCLYLDNDNRLISERYSRDSDGSVAIGREPARSEVRSVQHGTILLSTDEAIAFESQLKTLVNQFTRNKSLQPGPGMKEYAFIAAITKV